MRGLCLLAVLLLAGSCAARGESGQTPKELEDRISALEQQLDEARHKAQEVEDAASQLETADRQLEGDLGRLSSQDWRDVVPSLSSDAHEVGEAQHEIEAASEAMTRAVAEQ